MSRARLSRLAMLGAAVVTAAAFLRGGPAPAVASPDGSASPMVRIEQGAISGRTDGGVDRFLGLPYAASTAGANRWRPPQPVASWTGVRAAVRYGPDCAQAAPFSPPGGLPWTPEYLPSGRKSEDCLSLNVWTPRARAGSALPVLVWIHGGGFSGGSTSVPIYDGANLARRGIVVVTINYRLGPFGFLAHPWLTAEDGSSGDYGLMDQVAALRWVARNVRAFGGDPAKVTIAGQSAGAASVHYLMAAPSTRGLFRRAIAESGSGLGLDAPDFVEAQRRGVVLVNKLGATKLAQLREAPVDQILSAGSGIAGAPPGMAFVPSAAPGFLPEPAQERSDIAVLTGLNADENSAGFSRGWRAATRADLDALLDADFGPNAGLMAKVYPVTTDAAAGPTARALLRDRGVAAMLQWGRSRAAGAAPAYGYLFNHIEPGPEAERWGAFHSSEIPYVFGTFDASTVRSFGVIDHALSTAIQAYWVAFAARGVPDPRGFPAWPRLATGRIMAFGVAPTPMVALSRSRLAAFDEAKARGAKIAILQGH